MITTSSITVRAPCAPVFAILPQAASVGLRFIIASKPGEDELQPEVILSIDIAAINYMGNLGQVSRHVDLGQQAPRIRCAPLLRPTGARCGR
jgi:hypothetical protein